MSKSKIIIRGSGAKDKSVLVDKAENVVLNIDKYVAVFMPEAYKLSGESIIATEATNEEFYIVLNKKRVTTVLLNRTGNDVSEDGQPYFGEDFSGVVVVLIRCKHFSEGFQYHLAYVQGKQGGYSNILFETYGMQLDMLSIFKKMIKIDDKIKCLPICDKFVEQVDDVVISHVGSEKYEQEIL